MAIIGDEHNLDVFMENGVVFSEAINKGNIQEVCYILDTGKHEVNSVDEGGRTALFHATSRGNFDLVKVLVDRGADVNILDIHGNCVLHWCGHPDVLQFLVNKGTRTTLR